jgi:hypothetical protein
VSDDIIVLTRDEPDDRVLPSVSNGRRGLMILDAYRHLTGADETTDAPDLIADILHALTMREPNGETDNTPESVVQKAVFYFETSDEGFEEDQ